MCSDSQTLQSRKAVPAQLDRGDAVRTARERGAVKEPGGEEASERARRWEGRGAERNHPMPKPAAPTGVGVGQWRCCSIGGRLRPWPNESSKDTAANREGGKWSGGWGVVGGRWSREGAVEGKMRHRRPAESLSSPRSRSAPSANPRAAWGWWTQACAQWGGEGAAPSHRGRSGRAKVLPSLRTRVLPPALFRSVTQITVWGLGPCGGVGRRRGRAAEGVTAIGTGCTADSAPTGGGDEESWLLTQPSSCCLCCPALPCGQTPLPSGRLIWSKSAQNFASRRCYAHSRRQLRVTSCGAVLWEPRELDAKTGGISLLAYLCSGEVRGGCGQVETPPEYITFLYWVSGKGT